MNQVGLGVDIVDNERIEAVISRSPNFISHVYTQDEISYCNSRANSTIHFATHFAAKEAVLKALDLGIMQGISVSDIEVAHNQTGKPYIILHGSAKQIVDEREITSMPISLSYSHTEAVAVAIAMKNEYAPKVDKADDIVAQLSSKFKEVKKLIDEGSIDD